MIRVSVAGQAYEGFNRIEVTDSFLNVCKNFKATIPSDGKAYTTPLLLNAPCTIRVNDKLILTGYLEDLEGSKDTNAIDLAYTGRDILCDLVDSTIDASVIQAFSGNLSFDDLCRQVIAKLGLKVRVVLDAPTRTLFKASDFIAPQVGESYYDYLERYAVQKQLFLNSTPRGDLLIRTSNSAVTIDNTLQSVVKGANNNILKSRVKFLSSKLFNEYRCHAQQQKIGVFMEAVKSIVDFNEQVVDILGVAKNSSVRPTRIYNFLSDTAIDSSTAKDRATWQANFANSKYFTYTCEVEGYTYNGTDLWAVNTKVHVIDSTFDINSVLLISSITFKLDLNVGERTVLTLVLGDSFTLLAERNKQKQASQQVGKVYDATQ